MPSSSSSSSSILGLVLWFLFVGLLMLGGAAAWMWHQNRPSLAGATVRTAEEARLEAAKDAEFDKVNANLQAMRDLQLLMKQQLSLIERLKQARDERKAAKRDNRLAELIDKLEGTDAMNRRSHEELTASLERFQAKRGQGELDQHIDKAMKTNSKVEALLEMQEQMAKEDRALVDVK